MKCLKESSSNLLFFLPATTDRKEDINRFKRNVMLHPFDIFPDQLQEWNNSVGFNPRDLELAGEKRTRAGKPF